MVEIIESESQLPEPDHDDRALAEDPELETEAPDDDDEENDEEE